MEILLKETKRNYRIKVNGKTRETISKDTPNAKVFAKCRCFDIMFCAMQFRGLGSAMVIEGIEYEPKKEPSYMREIRTRDLAFRNKERKLMKVV